MGVPSLVLLAALEGDLVGIARSRDFAREVLSRVQTVHGLPVSGRVMGMLQRVVSELVTNAFIYGPGPALLDPAVEDGAVQVMEWDSDLDLAVARAADPGRVGQHRAAIVMAVCQRYEVEREPVGMRTTVAVVLADDPGGQIAARAPLLG
ncbi:ATP-binding protein [Streptomyces sp. NPDC055722]